MKAEIIMLSFCTLSVASFWICYTIHYITLHELLKVAKDTKTMEEVKYKLKNEKNDAIYWFVLSLIPVYNLTLALLYIAAINRERNFIKLNKA